MGRRVGRVLVLPRKRATTREGGNLVPLIPGQWSVLTAKQSAAPAIFTPSVVQGAEGAYSCDYTVDELTYLGDNTADPGDGGTTEVFADFTALPAISGFFEVLDNVLGVVITGNVTGGSGIVGKTFVLEGTLTANSTAFGLSIGETVSIVVTVDPAWDGASSFANTYATAVVST